MNEHSISRRSGLAALLLLLSLATATAQTSTPLDEARTALQAGDLARAESLLGPLTGADAQEAPAFHALGRLRERQGKLSDAVAAHERATKLDPTQSDYFSALGIALSQRMAELNFMQQAMVAGKMKKAFEKSVELDPRHIAGLIGLARYYASAPEIAGGSMTKAAEFAERVKKLDAFLGELELGRVSERDESFDEALVHFQAAVRLKPGHAGAQSACGRILAKLGRKDGARAHFEAALKIVPDFEPARKGLAELDAPAESKG